MKRRVTSILLTLIMILSLLPAGVLAADEGPMLKLHVRAEENGKEFEVPVTEWTQHLGNREYVKFVFYDADGTAEQLDPEDVELPEFMSFFDEEEDGWIRLQVDNVGTGVIAYQEYTIPVTTTLPGLGIYSELPASGENFLEEPVIDEDNNVFYIALSPEEVENGIRMIQVSDQFDQSHYGTSLTEIGTVELSQDGTYATVTVTDLTAEGHHHFEAIMTNLNDDSQGTWGRTVWISNNTSRLYYCHLEDHRGDWFVRTEYAESTMWTPAGNDYHVSFFFGKRDEVIAGTVEPIPAEQLTFPDFVQVTPLAERVEEGAELPDHALEVRVTRFAEADERADIVYTLDGVQYTLPIQTELPEVGFYSEPEASKASYLHEYNPFVVTETDRTFYLCVLDPQNMRITDILSWNDSDMADLFTVTPSVDGDGKEDGRYLAITAKDGVIVPNRGCGLELEYSVREHEEEPWRISRSGAWMKLKNGQPTLMYRYLEWDERNEGWRENDTWELHTQLDMGSGDSTVVQFYYGTEESMVPVGLDSLTFPTGIVKGSLMDNICRVEGVGFEERGVITYADGDISGEMKVYVHQPEFGVYTDTTVQKDTYLGGRVVVDAAVDTFYVVADVERTMTSFEGIREVRYDGDASEYFDVQFGNENGMDYAKITLKKDDDGVYLAYGGRYVILIEQEWGIRYLEFELIRNDLEPLSTPSDLTWHIEYGWDWENEVVVSEDRMGAMGFKVGELTQNRYRVQIYSDADQYTEPVLDSGWQFGDMDHSTYFSVSDFIYAELPNGIYRFRVLAEGDGTKYRDSAWSELSPEFRYTVPEAQLTAVDARDFAWERWDAMYHSVWNRSLEEGARYYEVRWSYMEDGIRREHAGSFDMQAWDMENIRMDAGLPDDFLSDIGNRDLYFRVRVIPADVTQYRVSPWSDYSEALVMQDITDFVNNKLDNLVNQPAEPEAPQPTLTVEDVQNALFGDTADLRTAMAADLELSGGISSGTLERIEQLEQIVEDNVEQKVEAEVSAPAEIKDIADGITMVGATLNLAVGAAESEETPTVTLKLDAPEEGIVIPEQQHNAVQFSMKLDGAVDTNDREQAGQLLIVPVVIDMPVPEGINPHFLVILHKLWDGSIEQMRPYIYWNDTDDRYHARFVVDSFSDFAMVEYFGFAETTVEKTVGDADFVMEATASVAGGTITYASSDSKIAEVDAETGRVTVKKAGTVTITATISAWDVYEETSASYTLVVKAKSAGGNEGGSSGSGSGSGSSGSSGSGSGSSASVNKPVEKVEITFSDVTEDAYYCDAVQWAVENNITNGIGQNTFGPDVNCTRVQAVMFLWNAAGRPEPKTAEMPFADVAVDNYYYKAVLWAMENGITNGTGVGIFSPDATCTRAQIVTFLWRAQGAADVAVSTSFADVAAEAYYAKPVVWAAENGITTGTGADTFSPDAICTRAQIVTFLWRCLAE